MRSKDVQIEFFRLPDANAGLIVQNIHSPCLNPKAPHAAASSSDLQPFSIISINLRRCLGRSSCVCLVHVLHLALLAILYSASAVCPTPTTLFITTHLPLGEPELALTPPLRSDALVLLERAAYDARCDRNVAVVPVASSIAGFRANGAMRGVRDAGGFPRECHCDGWMRCWGLGGGWR